MMVYGRITGEDRDAWLFEPAYLLDRDPPLGEAVRIPKPSARRGPRVRWANLDALRIWQGAGGGHAQGSGRDNRNRQDLPLFAAAGVPLD